MAVTRARKHEQVEKLGKDLQNVSTVIVTTYTKLTVAQDFRFQRFRKDGVGDNQCQNRWHPAGQEDRDNNVEALKTIKFQPDPLVSQLHTAGARR